MELKVCKNCRRLFKYIYGPELCQDCIKLSSKDDKIQSSAATQPASKSKLKSMVVEDEEKFIQVKDYIMANPIATIVQIAEVNDITPIKLFEWIRDDRLEFSENSQYAWFECEKCGAKIKSGRMCNKCKIK
ncbi:MAG: hypothetical protein ACYDEX_02435 [Mobilitalea sp.]